MQPLLQVEKLSKRFGAIRVADALDLELRVGECLGVIGPNGAGKTSLLHLLSGAVHADAGSIRFDGHDVTKLPLDRRVRLGVARAFQIPQPFPQMSVYENVLVGATFGAGLGPREAMSASAEALRVTGLMERRDELAGRLTLLNRKRLELAKALAMGPKLLLLDEIAAGLTEPEIVLITDLIQRMKPRLAIIWIEHISHALAAVCDRILVMHFGRKLMEGPPATVLQSAEVREIYMGIAVDSPAQG